MEEQCLKRLLRQALHRLSESAKATAAHLEEVLGDVHDFAVTRQLQDQRRMVEGWQGRLAESIELAGSEGAPGAPVLDGLFQSSAEARRQAKDDTTLDLSIVDHGRMTLHVWISAWTTAARYARQLELGSVAERLETCAEEASAAENRHHHLADRLLGSQPLKGV